MNESPSLEEVRRVRNQMVEALDSRIRQLKEERFEMDAEYDREIGELEDEQRALGVRVPAVSRPTAISDVAQRVHRWLLSNPGWHTAAVINANVPNTAVLSVMMRPLIDAGRVQHEGERKGSRYRATTGPTPAEGSSFTDASDMQD